MISGELPTSVADGMQMEPPPGPPEEPREEQGEAEQKPHRIGQAQKTAATESEQQQHVGRSGRERPLQIRIERPGEQRGDYQKREIGDHFNATY